MLGPLLGKKPPSNSCVSSLGQQVEQTSIQRVMEDFIAKSLRGDVDRLIAVLLPAISHAVSEHLVTAIEVLTSSSLAPGLSLASEKCDPNLSPTLSEPDVMIPEKHANVEDLTTEYVTASTKRRADEDNNTPSPSGSVHRNTKKK